MEGDIDNRPIQFGPDGQPRYLPADVDAFELDCARMEKLSVLIRNRNMAKRAYDRFLKAFKETEIEEKTWRYHSVMKNKMSRYVAKVSEAIHNV